MQRSRETKKQKLQQKGCSVLCCSCRLSVSSSEEAENSANSVRYPSISSIAHAMVQERLDQMIRDRQEARNKAKRRARAEGSTKFIVMVAMEKSSYDPRQDFRDSIEQVIRANRISEPRDLRRLMDYYVSVNSEEYQALILEVFYDVCSSLFTDCKRHFRR